jgi:hypothetical protein
MSDSGSADKAKSYVVIVNGQEKLVPSTTVTFAEIVVLAFPDKAGDANLTYVVTYRKAEKPKEGTLAEGGTIEIKHRGTIFNVTFTRKS